MSDQLDEAKIMECMEIIANYLLNYDGEPEDYQLTEDQINYLNERELNADECIKFVDKLENVLNQCVEKSISQVRKIIKQLTTATKANTKTNFSENSMLGDNWTEDLKIFSDIEKIQNSVPELKPINKFKESAIRNAIAKFKEGVSHSSDLFHAAYNSKLLLNYIDKIKPDANLDDALDEEDSGEVIIDASMTMIKAGSKTIVVRNKDNDSDVDDDDDDDDDDDGDDDDDDGNNVTSKNKDSIKDLGDGNVDHNKNINLSKDDNNVNDDNNKYVDGDNVDSNEDIIFSTDDSNANDKSSNRNEPQNKKIMAFEEMYDFYHNKVKMSFSPVIKQMNHKIKR